MSSLSQAASSAEKRTNARYWIVVLQLWRPRHLIHCRFGDGQRHWSGSGRYGLRFLCVLMGLRYRADPGRLAAGPFWFQTRLLLVHLHLVHVYPVTRLRRYLQRIRHYRRAVYLALPRRSGGGTVLPRQQSHCCGLVPGTGEGNGSRDL